MKNTAGIEIYDWNQVGYKPLVFSHEWQVAILNYEPVFNLKNFGEIERHRASDEVFVLLAGRAVLFTISIGGVIQVDEMQQHKIYNVTKSSWHNLLATHDAKWIIVENINTHISDTEIRQLTKKEREEILKRIPPSLINEQERAQ